MQNPEPTPATIQPDGSELPTIYGHGGRRKNAGRKRAAGKRPSVKHRTRPRHAQALPSHVTIPFLKRVGSLRKERVFKKLRAIFLRPKINGFQVVHYSVQKDHVHLIVEAVDKSVLSSGLRSLCIRAALMMNRLFATKGKVLRDRYHRRDLFSPRQVRDVLVYVLLNGAKHNVVLFGAIDRFSSSADFDGWSDVDHMRAETIPRATGDPPPRRPWTRMLDREWRAYNLISVEESIRWAPPFGPDD